jgi:hypothetical protein
MRQRSRTAPDGAAHRAVTGVIADEKRLLAGAIGQRLALGSPSPRMIVLIISP